MPMVAMRDAGGSDAEEDEEYFSEEDLQPGEAPPEPQQTGADSPTLKAVKIAGCKLGRAKKAFALQETAMIQSTQSITVICDTAMSILTTIDGQEDVPEHLTEDWDDTMAELNYKLIELKKAEKILVTSTTSALNNARKQSDIATQRRDVKKRRQSEMERTMEEETRKTCSTARLKIRMIAQNMVKGMSLYHSYCN